MSFSTFFLLPKYLKVALHATDSQIGTLGALGSVAGVFAFPLVGVLNDRLGRKRFMLLGSGLMTVTSLAPLALPTLGLAFYGSRLLHGLSFALFYNSASTLMSDRVAPARLGVALGVFGSSLLVTNALAPALAELLSTRYGWSSVFWVASAWSVLSFLGGLLVRGSAKRHTSQRAGTPEPRLLSTPRARITALAIAGAGAGFGTVFTFHQPYALALGIEQVSGFFLAYAAAALLGRMALLSRLELHDRQRVSSLAMLLYALAVAATAWLRPGLLEGIGLVLGLAHGVLYPVFNALAIQGVGPTQRGSMMALYHGGFNGGMAASLLLGGTLAERFGYPVLFWSTGALTAAAAWLLAQSPALADAR